MELHTRRTALEQVLTAVGLPEPRNRGEMTLELYNANRCAIELTAGRRVGQLVFARMDAPALRPYDGKYQGQRGATGSRVYLDAEEGRKE